MMARFSHRLQSGVNCAGHELDDHDCTYTLVDRCPHDYRIQGSMFQDGRMKYADESTCDPADALILMTILEDLGYRLVTISEPRCTGVQS